MMYVYLMRSKKHPARKYIGLSNDPQRRLHEHNAGKVPHTSKFLPWKMSVFVWFDDEPQARAFEKYLKIGSGHAFANRHFW